MRHYIVLSTLVFTACAVPGLNLATTSPQVAEPPPVTSSAQQARDRDARNDAARARRNEDRISFGAVWQAHMALMGHESPREDDYQVDPSVLKHEAEACSERVKVDLARGVAPDHTYSDDSRRVDATPGNAEERICKPLADIAAGWPARLAAEKKQEADDERRAAAPYKKAGIDGDKLELMLRTDGYVYLPGQIRATPASAARASVLFDDATDTEGRYIVWRTTFSGNKQLSRTHRAFWTHPGRDAYQ